MVDWDTVEKLRSKGWDWNRIAEDPRVGFKADSSIDEPGRALKALYYQRRSKAERKPARERKGEPMETPEARERRWTLERVGLILTPLFGIWFLLAYVYPSPIGVSVPALPVLGLLLAASAFILAFGMLRATQRWNKVLRNTTVMGVVAGVAIAGAFGIAGLAEHCPTLTSITTAEPSPPGASGSWFKAANPAWTENGAPALFFYGSAACPYCSASSWAFQTGLPHFGIFTGLSYAYSSPTDSPPSIPSAVLSATSLQSTYVGWTPVESSDPNTISFPAAENCVQSAYLSTYNPLTNIPFVVVGGIYVHTGSLVSPTLVQGLTVTAMQGQMAAQSGQGWNAVSPAMFYLMAYIVKVNGGQPTTVAQIPQVAAALALIS